MNLRLYGWLCLSAVMLAGVLGCPEEGGGVQRTAAENSALEQDKARLQRELGDCQRELEKTRKIAAESLASGKKDHDSVEEMRQALEQLTQQRDAAVKTQEEMSRKLMEAEKQLAVRGQDIGRAAKAVRAQEARIAELVQEVERLRRELSTARRNANTAPSGSE